LFSLSRTRHPPASPLFPYPPLFRSVDPNIVGAQHAAPPPNHAPLHLRACTYASAKFPGRAPAGHVLLRAFLAPGDGDPANAAHRSEEHTSELQSRFDLVCRLLLEKK